MLDRFDDFVKVRSHVHLLPQVLKKKPVVQPLLPKEEDENFDRELIKDFLEQSSVVEVALVMIGQNNDKIKKLAEEQLKQVRASKEGNRSILDTIVQLTKTS